MAHTPGPWQILRGKPSGTARAISPVLNWNSLKRNGHDYEANACLIAAAPEAHGILSDIAACVLSEGECRITKDAQFKRILDYLAKVEGR